MISPSTARSVALSLGLLAVAGCDGGGAGEPGVADNFGVTADQGDADCEPLDPHVCMFPYPSDRFRTEEGQVRFGEGTLPALDGGAPLDPALLVDDGFSIGTSAVFSMPGATVPHVDGPAHIADSLKPDSPTVVIDASTGQRVAHWLEIDHFSREASVQVLMIRFASALSHERRYVVGIRGLQDASGAVLPAAAPFAELRDSLASRTRGVHARRAWFDGEVFPLLEAADVVRGDLQLAWDFTTGDDSQVTRLVAMRDALVAAIGEQGPTYEITEVIDDPDPGIRHLIHGVAKVPSFLLPPDEQKIRLIRTDAAGQPVIEGFEDVPFDLQIPHSAYDAPAAIVQFAHGLLGTREQSHKGWLRAMAQREGFAVIAIDMQGMNLVAGGAWIALLTQDTARFPQLTDEIAQGVLNHVAVARMARRRIATDLADPAKTDDRFNPDALPLLDPERVYYYGNSQGGTMGNIVMSLSTEIERGVLGVPGCCFGFLLQRSVDFKPFQGALSSMFADDWALSATLALIQNGFDRIEPLNFVQLLTPDSGKRVLLHVAKEDAQVVNDASFILARTYGAPLLSPTPRPVWGLTEVLYPHEGPAAVVEMDFGHPDNPDPTAPPPSEHDTHRDLREHRVGQDQVWRFLSTGVVESVCDGACDPQ